MKILLILVFSLALVGCQKASPTTQPYATNQNSNQPAVNQQPIVNQQPSMPNPVDTATITDEVKIATEAVFKTSLGSFTVELYAADSPKTVANFVKLVKAGFYNGTKFHRIIEDFMIQGGDPLSKDDKLKARWGTGGPGYEFADEFNGHKLVRGSLAMANSGPDTNGSQFFIVVIPSTPWLDGKHTNFGEVISGMEVVDNIKVVATDSSDRPVENVVITSIEVQ